MSPRVRNLLLASVVLVTALPGVAAAQFIELEGRVWVPGIDAQAKIEGGASAGTTIDFDRDLGIGTEPLPELRLSVFTGPNSKLRLAYTHGRWDGDTVIGQAIEFNGTTYPAGARVVSDLDLHYARLGWIWQPSLIPGVFTLGPIVEAKAFVAEMTLKAPNLVPRLQETERVTLVIPTVGLAADFRLFPLVNLFAEASGLTIGHPGHVVDAEAGARLSVLPFIAVTGGYRFFEVSGGENRSSARLRLSGPFLGVSVRF